MFLSLYKSSSNRFNILTERRRGRVAASGLVLAVLLGGCTSGPVGGGDPVGEYTAPAWMAQVAQRNEELGQAIVSCMAEAGYTASVDVDGFVTGVNPEFSDLAQSKAAAEQRAAIGQRCGEQARMRYGPVPELSDDELYGRISQTAACVRANGYPDIGEPPSRDVWLEAFAGSTPWSAYEQLWTLHGDTMSAHEWRRLKTTCIEDGVVWSMDSETRQD